MMLVFIPWDIVFTHYGFWGFNPDYLIGYTIANLPIEEWLFFICIPYACVFTHYTLSELLPNFRIPLRISRLIYVLLACILVVTLWYQYDQWYTLVSFAYALVLLGITLNRKPELLPVFFASYLVILIPFFIVNGFLTGSWLDEPVVWYNDVENMGIRLGTIPLEDTIYNLGMLLTVVLVMELQLEKSKSV